MVTLDYINKIEIDENNLPVSNVHALDYLAMGLYELAKHVKEIEEEILKEYSFLGGKGTLFSFGITNSLFNDGLIACYFHWFGVSIVNYARLVAWLDIMYFNNWKAKNIKKNRNKIANYCTQYVKEVMPDLYIWRNKIAAHFAATDPRDDNIGTLEISLINPITFSREPNQDRAHYYVGEFQKGSGPSEQETSNIPKWSLVTTYEELIPRYWPEYKI